MKKNTLTKLLVGVGILALSGSLFAMQVPATATTDFTLQNSTSGAVSVDLGQFHPINLKADNLNPSLPTTVSTPSYHGTATQNITGQSYSFDFPVDFAENLGTCVIQVSYNSNTDHVTVKTDTSKLQSSASCIGTVTQQGDNNQVTVTLKTS